VTPNRSASTNLRNGSTQRFEKDAGAFRDIASDDWTDLAVLRIPKSRRSPIFSHFKISRRFERTYLPDFAADRILCLFQIIVGLQVEQNCGLIPKNRPSRRATSAEMERFP